MSCPASWVALGAQVIWRGRPTAIKGHLFTGAGMAISYAQREAGLSLAVCIAVGCIGGFVVSGVRMWWEVRRHGSD